MFGQPKIDFLIIGAQKCGSSSLYRYLTAQLRVHGPERKEVHYFDFFHSKGKRWYDQQFDFSRPGLYGEASPFYLMHPEAPRRAREYNPKLKLIAILRDPAERALSHYLMNRQRGIEELSFSEALAAEDERLAHYDADAVDNPLQNFSYRRRGLYAEQLARWEAEFPTDQMLVLNYHHFFKDPWREVQAVYRFLAAPPFYGTGHYHQNKRAREVSDEAATLAGLRASYQQANRQLADKYGIEFG